MEEKRIAILIDAENVSYKNATQIIDTMAAKGTIVVKTIVADWTKITGAKKGTSGRSYQIEGWRKEANKHSMTATQAFSYVSGKNHSLTPFVLLVTIVTLPGLRKNLERITKR